MRLVSYGVPGREKAGVLIGERVVPCDELVPGAGTMRAALGEGMLAKLQEKAAGWQGRALPLSMLRLGPPVPDPRAIICVGLNYRSHALEQKKPWPKQPLLFAKSQNALAGPRDDVTIPENDPRLDWEVELAVVIGARTHRAEPAKAMAAVAGYAMVANDLSGAALAARGRPMVPRQELRRLPALRAGAGPDARRGGRGQGICA